MKFVSTRELRNRPGYVRDLVRQDEVVLTMNGKPFGLVLGIKEGELEETAQLVRQAKAQRALSHLRREAREREVNRLTARQIDAEIRAVRSKRRPK